MFHAYIKSKLIDMSAAPTGRTIPGLTNPYPVPEKTSNNSTKKGRRGGKRHKKGKEKNDFNDVSRAADIDQSKVCTSEVLDTKPLKDSTSTVTTTSLNAAEGSEKQIRAFDILNTEELISQLRVQLEKAREQKDHQTANIIRQRIWLLKDAAAGVVSNISEEDLQAVLTQTNNLRISASS